MFKIIIGIFLFSTSVDAASFSIVQPAVDSTKVAKTGDTMTGDLSVPNLTATYGVNADSVTATSFYGDGSNLTGISGGDNLGNHIATQTLNMGSFPIIAAGSITAASMTVTGASGKYGLTVSSNVALAGVLYSANGNIGIGTTGPTRLLSFYQDSNPTLHIANSITGSAAGDGTYWQQNGLNAFLINQEAGYFAFGTGSTQRMILTSGGNVGIGTTAPGSKLHVSSGTLTMDGTGSPVAGKALCFTAAKLLGTCSDTPDASGNCTCAAP